MINSVVDNDTQGTCFLDAARNFLLAKEFCLFSKSFQSIDSLYRVYPSHLQNLQRKQKKRCLEVRALEGEGGRNDISFCVAGVFDLLINHLHRNKKQ
jgi:hypothetical protein